MKTSYFAKSGKDPNAVSIALFPPHFYKGRQYTLLAPSIELLADYKSGKIGEKEYRVRFNKQLKRLDPRKVYKELGEDAIMLCWEGKDKFCHRHLVAHWLHFNLGVEIKEVD